MQKKGSPPLSDDSPDVTFMKNLLVKLWINSIYFGEAIITQFVSESFYPRKKITRTQKTSLHNKLVLHQIKKSLKFKDFSC